MRNLFNLDAPIIQWLSKFSLLLWIACLWLICCLPVVTAGAATAALYRMVFNLREESSCSAGAFFRAFRENFKQSTWIWLIVLGLAALLAAGYYGAVLVEAEMVRLVLVVIVCVLFVLWVFLLLYSFPLTCYFENSLRNTLKNALAMSIKHLRQTIFCFALAVIPLIALMISAGWFVRLLYVWVLFYPGLAAYWIAGILSPVFEQYAKQ